MERQPGVAEVFELFQEVVFLHKFVFEERAAVLVDCLLFDYQEARLLIGLDRERRHDIQVAEYVRYKSKNDTFVELIEQHLVFALVLGRLDHWRAISITRLKHLADVVRLDGHLHARLRVQQHVVAFSLDIVWCDIHGSSVLLGAHEAARGFGLPRVERILYCHYFLAIFVIHFELVACLVHRAMSLEDNIDSVLVDEGAFFAQRLHLERPHELHVIYHFGDVDADSAQLLEKFELVSQALLTSVHLLLGDHMLVGQHVLDQIEVVLGLLPFLLALPRTLRLLFSNYSLGHLDFVLDTCLEQVRLRRTLLLLRLVVERVADGRVLSNGCTEIVLHI